MKTYIASGNVLFGAPKADPRKLAVKIEKALAEAFDYDARVVVRSKAMGPLAPWDAADHVHVTSTGVHSCASRGQYGLVIPRISRSLVAASSGPRVASRSVHA